MGRHKASIPAVTGLSEEEIRLLETLDDETPPTYAQRAVGRVIGTLFHRYTDGAPRELLAVDAAASLGAIGRRKAVVARGEHFIRMAVASGYVAYDGGGFYVLTDAGRDLAERATAKMDAAAAPSSVEPSDTL